ncbi:MAG TPA: cytochrome b N-terminal domain-containing protein [bacterium]
MKKILKKLVDVEWKELLKTGLEKRFNFSFEAQGARIRKFLITPVAEQFSWLNFFGIVICLLFVILLITGLSLALYYKPIADDAHLSIKYIMNSIPSGWLIRSIHHWASTLLFIFVFLHFWRIYFTGAYKYPRELLWFIGLANLALVFLFGFTGYLLPWSNNSYWSTQIMTSEIKDIPLIGDYIMLFIRGGEGVGSGTLTRFFVSHIVILPGLFLAITGIHIWMIFRQGLTKWKSVSPKNYRYSVSVMLLDINILIFVLFALLISLSVFIPAGLGDIADPLRMPAKIIPAWFMMPIYNLYKFFPREIFIFNRGTLFAMSSSVIILLLVLLPFLDRNEQYNPLKRSVIAVIGIAGLVLLLFLISYGTGR